MNLLEYLNENYVMIVPALWVIGYALKQTPSVPNWSIIWILTVLSVSIAGITFGFSLESFSNGIIAAGTAVFGHQMLKQTLERDVNKKKDEDKQ